MRTLNFTVQDQTLSLDSNSSLDDLNPGSSGYLFARFKFSKEWEGCVKVAAFYSNLGVEYPPQVIQSSGVCMIPNEALAKSIFKIQVIGRKGDYKIGTNKLTIRQKGGKS